MADEWGWLWGEIKKCVGWRMAVRASRTTVKAWRGKLHGNADYTKMMPSSNWQHYALVGATVDLVQSAVEEKRGWRSVLQYMCFWEKEGSESKVLNKFILPTYRQIIASTYFSSSITDGLFRRYMHTIICW